MTKKKKAAPARRRVRNPKPRDRRDAPAAITPITLDDPTTFPRIYASGCVGDCLEPVLHDGCTLIFDKEASYGAGDFVAIWLKPEAVKPGTHNRMVKRLALGVMPGLKFPYAPLAGNCAPIVIAETLNPPRAFMVPISDILAIHRCIGEAAPAAPGLCRMIARFMDGGEIVPVPEVVAA